VRELLYIRYKKVHLLKLYVFIIGFRLLPGSYSCSVVIVTEEVTAVSV